MVARWSANPFGILWPEMEEALAGDGGRARDVGWWRRPAARGTAAGGHHRRCLDPSIGEGDPGVQGSSIAVIDVTPGDYFEVIARQTSASTKNVAADELTWFALEVVE